MKEGKIIVALLIFFIFIETKALQICDWGDFSDSCNGWTLHSFLGGMESLTGSYTDIPLGFFGSLYKEKEEININFYIPVWSWGNAYQDKPSSSRSYKVPVWAWGNTYVWKYSLQRQYNIPIWAWWNSYIQKQVGQSEYNIPVWFWWTSYKEKSKTEALNYVPIWHFNYYKGKNIVFPELGSQKRRKTRKHSTDRTPQEEEKSAEMTIKQALQYLFQREIDDDFVFSQLFYLYPELKMDEKLNYKNLSLLMTNIEWQFIVSDSKVTFTLFQKLWLFLDNYWAQERVRESSFLEIYEKINTYGDFRKTIIENIDQAFDLNEEKVSKDLLFVYELNKKLSEMRKNKPQEYYEVIWCFSYDTCSNQELYIQIKMKLERLILEKQQNFDRQTSEIGGYDYQQFFSFLFALFIDVDEISTNVSQEKKEKIVKILTEAMVYKEEDKNTQIWFLAYNRMKFILLESNLQENLSKIIQYADEIVEMYGKISDKGKLLDILRSYSFR